MDSNFDIECTIADLLNWNKEATAWMKLAEHIDKLASLKTDRGYRTIDNFLRRNNPHYLGKFISNSLLFITRPYKDKLKEREGFKQKVKENGW